MLLLLIILSFITTTDQEILTKISESNSLCLSDSTSPYILKKEKVDYIVQLLGENRKKVIQEIVKKNKKFSLTNQNDFKIIERIDFPYNNITGIIWGKDFAYCYKRIIDTDKIEICKVVREKLTEKSGIGESIIKEVEMWNVKLLRRMVYKPVDKWDKNYTDFLDSLKSNTTYNLAQTGDAFFLATNVTDSSSKNLQVSSIAFDGF